MRHGRLALRVPHMEQVKELPKPGHDQQKDDDEERDGMRRNEGRR